MSEQDRPAGIASQEELQDLVASVDTGGRAPDSKGVPVFPAAVAFVWSCFQPCSASPIVYELRFGVFNSTQSRSIHLSLSLFFVLQRYPARTRDGLGKGCEVLVRLGGTCSFIQKNFNT